MNHRNTYLKQRNKNTAICAYINATKTCQCHELNLCFSATHWTFHFETASKRAVRNIEVAGMYLEACISNEPGLDFLLSPTAVLTLLALLVLCRVGFPDHRPHWLEASEQALQKSSSARRKPEAVGLVAHGSALGSALLQLEHAVGEVSGLVA